MLATSRFLCCTAWHRRRPVVFQADDGEPWAVVVYAMCLHLAVKVVHVPRNSPARLGGYSFNGLLAYVCGMRLHREDIAHTEAWLLRSLRYDLLPCVTL